MTSMIDTMGAVVDLLFYGNICKRYVQVLLPLLLQLLLLSSPVVISLKINIIFIIIAKGKGLK